MVRLQVTDASLDDDRAAMSPASIATQELVDVNEWTRIVGVVLTCVFATANVSPSVPLGGPFVAGVLAEAMPLPIATAATTTATASTFVFSFTVPLLLSVVVRTSLRILRISAVPRIRW